VLEFLIRRVAISIVTLMVISMVVFTGVRMIPGDPARVLAGTDADAAGIDAIREKYGLNDPIPIQYLRWVGLALRGDLGHSIRTRESVITGNQNVAVRAAEEIGRYVLTNTELLKALAADLQNTGLETWQQDRILKNYVLQFREFREITLFDEHGATISAVVVIEVPKQLPLDAHMLEEESDARKLLEEARAIGASRGVAVRARVLRARGAGEAIVGEAEDGGADIVVLRAPRSGRRRRVFGKTAAYVLQHAPCRVLVVSPPPA